MGKRRSSPGEWRGQGKSWGALTIGGHQRPLQGSEGGQDRNESQPHSAFLRTLYTTWSLGGCLWCLSFCYQLLWFIALNPTLSRCSTKQCFVEGLSEGGCYEKSQKLQKGPSILWVFYKCSPAPFPSLLAVQVNLEPIGSIQFVHHLSKEASFQRKCTFCDPHTVPGRYFSPLQCKHLTLVINSLTDNKRVKLLKLFHIHHIPSSFQQRFNAESTISAIL